MAREVWMKIQNVLGSSGKRNTTKNKKAKWTVIKHEDGDSKEKRNEIGFLSMISVRKTKESG